jgi:hypothetical protein
MNGIGLQKIFTIKCANAHACIYFDLRALLKQKILVEVLVYYSMEIFL